MKTTKRLLSVLLALVLLCVGVPFAAQAEEGLAPTGSCGENVTWSFDADTGALIISGEGAMTDYVYPWYSPFYNDAEIKTLTINNGVMSIGKYAFYCCESLQSVTIPNTVLSINECAFQDCSSLTGLLIPDTVTSIGDCAFLGCGSLDSIFIGKNVSLIGEGAFVECNSITCFLVDENNTVYASDENGCLYNKNKTILIHYPSGSTRTSFTVPNSVTSVWADAFDNSSLVSVIIPRTVTSILTEAFLCCEDLISVTFGDGIAVIDCGVFAGCNNLSDIYYCGSEESWEALSIKEGNEPLQNAALHYHDPQIGKVVDPTCTEPGYTPFICTRCGETVSMTDPVDPLDHDPKPVYTWAKDDTTVTAEMTCTRCGDVTLKETAEVTAEVTVKPTCSTEGELTLTAAFNNKAFYAQTKTRVLPMDPDAHVLKVTVTPPTCLDDGYTTHACTLCRYGYSDNIVDALGHDCQHHDAKAPTCKGPGWAAYDTCSRCDYTTFAELAAVDHSDADNDGRCDMCENQMQGGDHCKFCGKIHNGGFFDKLVGFFHRILGIFKR